VLGNVDEVSAVNCLGLLAPPALRKPVAPTFVAGAALAGLTKVPPVLLL
jgi:hypothetical protein